MNEQTKIELLKIAASLADSTLRRADIVTPGHKRGATTDSTVVFADCLAQVEKSFNALGTEPK